MDLFELHSNSLHLVLDFICASTARFISNVRENLRIYLRRIVRSRRNSVLELFHHLCQRVQFLVRCLGEVESFTSDQKPQIFGAFLQTMVKLDQLLLVF